VKHLKYNQLSNNHVRYLQKKTNCVVYTRSEFIIMIHSMPHVVIPLNRCFLRKHLSSWRHNVASQEDGGLRVQRRSVTSLSEISLYHSIISDYTRRRRPMTLRIGPRLSLPSKSTSAPTTTTDGEWRALR